MNATLGLLALSLAAYAQPAAPPSLRSILLEQLHTTHDRKEWFVPANIAIAGLTPKQASWTDGSGNHSVGQLANHLVFWNRQQLNRFRGAPTQSNVVNDETFNKFDSATWSATVRQLDEVLTALEKTLEGATDKQLDSWASSIAHISTHNAYHIGQILYVRKLQGAWDPSNGVK
jgi:uncharacterized damage-inducible protein DinB